MLWKTSESKHEADLRVIYDVFIELSKFLPLENLDFMFSKILLRPSDLYDELFITLICDFSINAMGSLSSNQASSGCN